MSAKRPLIFDFEESTSGNIVKKVLKNAKNTSKT
jgi:hypothetical protein